MAVTVRRATRDDAPEVAAFAAALAQLHVGWNPKRFVQLATAKRMVQFYGDRAENGSVLVAESDGRVAGFAYFEYEPTLYAELATRVLWLHDIYVEPDHRRTGVGTALIARVRDAAKELGANKVLLSVAVQNTEGHGLFERNGFETTMHEMMLVIDNE